MFSVIVAPCPNCGTVPNNISCRWEIEPTEDIGPVKKFFYIKCPECGYMLDGENKPASCPSEEDALIEWNKNVFMKKLLSKASTCPFCGSSMQKIVRTYGLWVVRCTACGCQSGGSNSMKEALQVWNSRKGTGDI